MELDKLKQWLKEKLAIDSNNLDVAALETPQIHGEVMNLYTDASLEFKEALRKLNILRLQRWKYYAGKQTDKYYKEHPPKKETIVKSDIPMYMDSDSMMHQAQEVIDVCKAKVELLEHALKQLNQRPYLIKDAITFRQFMSGY